MIVVNLEIIVSLSPLDVGYVLFNVQTAGHGHGL